MLNNQSRRNPTLSNVPDPPLDEDEVLEYTCPDCGDYISENQEICDECLDDWEA